MDNEDMLLVNDEYMQSFLAKNTVKNYVIDNTDNINNSIIPNGKVKKPRKPRKNNGKKNDATLELGIFMKEYDNEKYDGSNETKFSKNDYTNYLQNSQYLSPKEKSEYENKFAKPKNASQRKYLQYLNNKNSKIIIATGPAGTGKTLFAVEYGMRNYLNGVYSKVIFTRPAVTNDEELGFLPGTLEEKMGPYIRPIMDIIYTFISPREVTSLIEEKIFEICPLGMMRGRTFKNTCIIADEMQNSTISQTKMLLTRIGENSKLILTGDLEQVDLVLTTNTNGLDDFLNRIKGRHSNNINFVEFKKADIEREEVVKEVLDIYDETNIIPITYDDDVTCENNSLYEDIQIIE